MMELGLCCLFVEQPIRFRRTTATAVAKLPRQAALARISEICLSNAQALLEALQYCHGCGIGSFRVNSQILPLCTHPTVGYDPRRLPDFPAIKSLFNECRRYAASARLRLTFHPDQFVVLNSLNPAVIAASIRELEYQATVAEWIGADVINIHIGGVYGDKPAALDRFAKTVSGLSQPVRSRLTIENDDRLYTVRDLLPVCNNMAIPLVYDVHHHRCNPDDLSLEQATDFALRTWNRRPLFHISSPCAGWKGAHPRHHHEYINARDLPDFWIELDITVEVEAKGKELAVLRLLKSLCRKRPQNFQCHKKAKTSVRP